MTSGRPAFFVDRDGVLNDLVPDPETGLPELLAREGFPERLDGMTVLDIGTSNGGAAFIAERRGAERVVAVDIYGPEWFGVDALRTFLGSSSNISAQASTSSRACSMTGSTSSCSLAFCITFDTRCSPSTRFAH
jgi:hypothetical protein